MTFSVLPLFFFTLSQYLLWRNMKRKVGVQLSPPKRAFWGTTKCRKRKVIHMYLFIRGQNYDLHLIVDMFNEASRLFVPNHQPRRSWSPVSTCSWFQRSSLSISTREQRWRLSKKKEKQGLSSGRVYLICKVICVNQIKYRLLISRQTAKWTRSTLT